MERERSAPSVVGNFSRFPDLASFQDIVDRDSHKDYKDGYGRFHRAFKKGEYQDRY